MTQIVVGPRASQKRALQVGAKLTASKRAFPKERKADPMDALSVMEAQEVLSPLLSKDNAQHPLQALDELVAVAPGAAPAHNGVAARESPMEAVRVGHDGRQVTVVTTNKDVMSRFSKVKMHIGLSAGCPVLRLYQDEDRGNAWHKYSSRNPDEYRLCFSVGKLRLGKRFPRWTLAAADMVRSDSPGELVLTLPPVEKLKPPKKYTQNGRKRRTSNQTSAPTKAQVKVEVAEPIVATASVQPTPLDDGLNLKAAIDTVNEAKVRYGELLNLSVTDAGLLRMTMSYGG